MKFSVNTKIKDKKKIARKYLTLAFTIAKGPKFHFEIYTDLEFVSFHWIKMYEVKGRGMKKKEKVSRLLA